MVFLLASDKPLRKIMPRIDYTYSDTWETRAEMLSELQYQEFLKSDHWKQIKIKAARRPKKYGACQSCGSTENIDLHHRTYKFLGTKHELQGVVPLCRKCHQEVHDKAKSEGISVRLATNRHRKGFQNPRLPTKRETDKRMQLTPGKLG